MQQRILILFPLLLILFHSCRTFDPQFDGSEWEYYASSSDAGFDASKLEELTEFIDEEARTTGMMVVYKGKVIYEYGDLEKISYIASCRKSVLAMLYGAHVESGLIDLNETIGDLGIDEEDGLLESEKDATVDHIITSRSGVFHEASNGGYDIENFKERGSVEPGAYWVYNNWDFNVGGHILELKTEHSVYEELESQLAIPLGFQDWNIENQRKSGNARKSQYEAYHMYLSTRDMAKIAQLMLNEGNWNGEQLIPRDWVIKTTSMVTPSDTLAARFGEPGPEDPVMSYSYMWWLVEDYQGIPEFEGAYTAIGYGGQYITVLPAIDMVVAHKTKLDLLAQTGVWYRETSQQAYFEILERLVEAMQ